MLNFNDYQQHDALGLASLIRSGELSASEVLEAAIDRAESRNPDINALVAKTYDDARATAKAALPDSPIAGVPFLIKDLAYLNGVPCTYGSRLYADNRVDHDATVVERYRAAGLVIFGKTNTPEFGLNVVTEPALFGPCRNPWNTDHTPGGSSGGAGAAVADGWLPVAHATDGGGSIRIPASCCGLVGLKPTRARNPAGPDVGEGWGGMSTGHVLARSVRDSAAFLDATHGPALGDPYQARPFEGSYLQQLTHSLRPLRIAVERNTMTGVAPHEECINAVERAAKLCEQLGHHVEEASPEIDRELFGIATGVIVVGNIANSVYGRVKALGRDLRDDDIEPHTRFMAESGRRLTAQDYAHGIQVIHQAGRTLAQFHETYDVMLTPTLVCPPVRVGFLDTVTDYDADAYNQRFVQFWGYTNLQNATGQPAVSLPLHSSSDNLPVGVQFVGPVGEELILLQLAAQLEEAAPWFGTTPPR